MAVAGVPAAGVAPVADIIAIQVFSRRDVAANCPTNNAACVLSFPSDQIATLDRVFDLRTTITCHDVSGPQTVPGTIANVAIVGGVLTGTVTANCAYGDASYPTFEVTVAVFDSDGDERPGQVA